MVPQSRSAPGWCLLAAAAAVIAGCLYDADRRCGPNMRYDAALAACVCVDGTSAVDGGCVQMPGLGTPCDDATPCTDATFSVCWTAGNGDQTCTRRCVVDTDCPDNYTCADWEAEPYCRTFTGYGSTCVEPADCAETDAKLCAQGFCTVAGCSLDLDDCPRGAVCCDFSAFGVGTVCVPPEFCP